MSGTDALLTIDHFATECWAAGTHTEARRLGERLDRLAGQRLPAALSDIADELHDGCVYRIRHLEVELGLAARSMTDAEMSRVWAAMLLRALAEELRSGPSGNVYRYQTHGHFFADLIIHLVRRDAWQCWRFDEFAALNSLDPYDAIVELVPSRLDYLPRVAAALAAEGMRSELLAGLGKARATRLMTRLQSAASANASARERLAAWSTLSADATAPSSADPGMRALELTLQIFAHAGEAAPAVLLCVAADIAAIESLARVAADLQRLRRYLDHGDSEPLPHTTAYRPDDPRVAALLALAAGSADGRAYVRALVDLAARAASDAPPSAADAAARDESADAATLAAPTAADAIHEFTSQFAGLVCVFMVVKALDWHTRLSPRQLRAVFTELVDPARRDALAREPLLVRCFPDGPGTAANDSAWPVLDADSGRLRPPEAADEHQAPASAAELAAHLARRFALGLAGLEQSSLAYLRTQFLERAGLVVMDKDSIVVRLASLPLGLVLRMAGMSGWQGRLPWLNDRDLIVEIP